MSDLNGLVLAGGRSSRMGADKSQMIIHGRPQVEHLVALLRKFCSSVFVSCRAEQHVAQGLNPIVDQFNISSPLNGILSAFQFNPAKSWLTVPVDMPNINSVALQFLVQHRNQEKLATCFFDSDGKYPEPLYAIWEQHAYPRLVKFYEEGGISPREFLSFHPIQLVQAPDKNWLVNINTTAEWNRWKATRSDL